MSVGTAPFFSPNQIPGCQLWLDAADPASLVLSGSNVTQWKDKSTNLNHFQSAGLSTSPTTSNYNGLTVVSWTDTSQQLTSTKNNATSGNAARSMFVLMLNPSSSSQCYLVTGTEAGGNPATAFGYAKNPNSDYNYPFLYSAIGADLFTFVQITSVPTILATTFNGSSISGWINSEYPLTKATQLNTTAGVWYLGKRQQNGTGSVNSFLLEIIQYNSAFTDAQRQQVEGYLAWKWGFQSGLPAGHPYKSSPIPPLLNPPRTTPQIGSRLWQPSQISGFQLWLDAADTTTLTLSGTSVTAWRDKSGTGLNVSQGTTALQPTYNATFLNGFPSIRFTAVSGSSYQELTTGTTNLFNSISNLNCFFVLHLLSSSTPPNPSPFSIQNKVSFYLSGLNNAAQFSGSNVWTFNGSSFVANQNTSITSNLSQQICLSLASGSQQLFTNGVVGGAQTSDFAFGSGTSLVLRIGYSGYNTNDGFNGYLSEVLLYTQALTTAQRQQVEGYLAWKWGLQANLPSNHPFKLWPPSP